MRRAGIEPLCERGPGPAASSLGGSARSASGTPRGDEEPLCVRAGPGLPLHSGDRRPGGAAAQRGQAELCAWLFWEALAGDCITEFVSS